MADEQEQQSTAVEIPEEPTDENKYVEDSNMSAKIVSSTEDKGTADNETVSEGDTLSTKLGTEAEGTIKKEVTAESTSEQPESTGQSVAEPGETAKEETAEDVLPDTEQDDIKDVNTVCTAETVNTVEVQNGALVQTEVNDEAAGESQKGKKEEETDWDAEQPNSLPLEKSHNDAEPGDTEVAGKPFEEQNGGTAAADKSGEERLCSSPIPQSDTFQDGERPETPTVQLPDPLSREGSPSEQPEPIDLGTPRRGESPRQDDIIEEEEKKEENYEEEPLYSREELLEAYQSTMAEREQLQNHNMQLQHKLAEYFRKKKSDDQRQEMDKNVTDQDQRYLKYMSNLEELRKQEEEERENFQIHLEELKEKKQEKLEQVDEEHREFTEMKRQVALNSTSTRSGKLLAPRDVEMYISNEQKKEEEVKGVRLENIKVKNRLKKREQQLKAKEELAEGLHLIDFEQLKIENQTYNEKIEERNEELLKLRKKITSTVQVLTHVKEKLQFVQAENQVQKVALREVESLVAQKRDVLSRTKKARDSLRIDNQKLRQKCGLLGNKSLLRDFEDRKDEGDELKAKLDKLKRQHAELVLKSAGVKRKIDETSGTRS